MARSLACLFAFAVLVADVSACVNELEKAKRPGPSVAPAVPEVRAPRPAPSSRDWVRAHWYVCVAGVLIPMGGCLCLWPRRRVRVRRRRLATP